MLGTKKNTKQGLNIIIVGCGKVGSTLVEQLCREGHDITIIDKNPNSELIDLVRNNFSYCSFDRSFRSDNLNHFTFTIYYR